MGSNTKPWSRGAWFLESERRRIPNIVLFTSKYFVRSIFWISVPDYWRLVGLGVGLEEEQDQFWASQQNLSLSFRFQSDLIFLRTYTNIEASLGVGP